MSEILERSSTTTTQLGIVDCDIHPTMVSLSALNPWLAQRWQQHLAQYGAQARMPFTTGTQYPKAAPQTARRDAWPPGGIPGSDLAFMQAQLLDAHDIAYGMLLPLRPYAGGARNTDLGAALCAAVNEWQIEEWVRRDTRLRASIAVAHEDAEAAVAEIERRAGDPNFVQVLLPSKTIEPLGRKRYWPIFAAAERHDIPVAIHVNSVGGGYASSAGGWPSYYLQDHHLNVHSFQALVASLVLEGVFEKFARLRMVMIEGGFAWLPALAWRLDKYWARMRDEVADCKRPPSEYIREQIWFTTQPIEEPEQDEHLRDTLNWIGWDRIMFSTDYPHWDYDDPQQAFKIRLSERERAMIFRDNACALYRL
jgi:predicted TIM-barrel fold metal-dependent hydrolase